MPASVASQGFSLRRRIMSLAVLLLVTAAIILVVFIRDYAERAADRAFDRLLAASALTIAGAVQIEDGAVTVELPFASFAMVSGSDRVFYTVEAPDGTPVTGYEDLAVDLPPATSLEPTFDGTDYRGEPVRVASLGRLVSTAQGTGWVTIRVAETRDARNALANEILGNAILPLGVLTALAMALVWFLIGRMFAPLLALEKELHARTPDDWSPVSVPVPREVSHLVQALNEFMERLKTAMDRVSALVAEAAHEVRTPLASLRAQAEVALDEPDPERLRARIVRIHQQAVHSSQLVSQLLMDATISHRLEMRETRRILVSEIVNEVLQRLDPDEIARVDVLLDPALDEAPLVADRVALREMLRNLIDNALRYSAGTVDVSARLADAVITLGVDDRGPGIAAEERPLVVQRFKRGRGAEAAVGSGLGLAIVTRVVNAHGGKLELGDRPGGGLAVRVQLPAYPVSNPMRLQAGRLAGLALALVLGGFALPAEALANPLHFPAAGPRDDAAPRQLTIVGTTDTVLFRDFITAFQRLNPDIAVTYFESETLVIYEKFLDGTLDPAPDLIISSAADLQMKLANDGHALHHASPYLGDIPAWAQWRGEVFGFTFEPAVIVYNPGLIAEEEVPRTHLGLAELMERETERFFERVATYDIATSGVGYLLAVQDQFISSQFWRLTDAFGRTGTILSGSSPDILARVADGELALGYNVLGSYAFARQSAGVQIGIVVPDDYVLALTRTIIIPRTATHVETARAFVDFALSPAGQNFPAGDTALGALSQAANGPWTAERITSLGRGAVQPIPLGPALLVSLDRQRRERFLQTWRGIVSGR
jgi:two-component system, OmpR family, sensor histidine kinase TctE